VTSPKVVTGHLAYPVAGRDTAKSETGCTGNRHLNYLAESNFVIGEALPGCQGEQSTNVRQECRRCRVVGGRESRLQGETHQSIGKPSKETECQHGRIVLMNVGEMQRSLSLKAEKERDHQFEDLYGLISHQDWLRLAHDHVKQNAGSKTAGCDGINMRDFDEHLDENMETLRQELKSKTFQPYPVRRVFIPKGIGKVRPLGILSIKDRIVQEALRMVLEPIYEADFRQYSFGFRPNRCTMDAIKCILWSAQEHKKYFWIIEGDIFSYFDTINHRKMVKLLKHRIEDNAVLTLLWKFLRAGVMEKKLFQDTKLGTPQGGIVSPLLANIYLNELDRYMERYTALSKKEKTQRRKQGLSNFVYVRYADDFVVLCNGTKAQAEALREELRRYLETELKLKLSMEKTKVTHLNDGFKFLGFEIQRKMGHNGMKTKVTIPKEAVDKVIDKTTAATSPKTQQESVNTKILAINRIIGGWCRYYQYTSRAATVFSKVMRMTFWNLAHWLGYKYKLKHMSQILRKFKQGPTLGTKDYQLYEANRFPTLQYKKAFLKPNPYTEKDVKILREELPTETYWTGYEPRPGMMDLRPVILKRDGYTCQKCGKGPLISKRLEVDHIRPVRRFKLPVNANDPDNLWTLCKECHDEKTKSKDQ
jgi:RNA-directed DNA polymerase